MRRPASRKTAAVLARSYPPWTDQHERRAARAFGLWLNAQLAALEERFGEPAVPAVFDPISPADYALLDPDEEQ